MIWYRSIYPFFNSPSAISLAQTVVANKSCDKTKKMLE